MKSKLATNWWIDLVLFASFIMTYFMDLTGLGLHQWLGILAGVLALWHLLRHMDWVTAVGKRFFTRTSNRARSYYILDALLFTGFLMILITGLVISTWLNLPLGSYSAWVNVHITASISSLVVLLLKVALHWRWIASTARKITQSALPHTARQTVPAGAGAMGRREFLKVLGVAGAASALALGSASRALGEVLSQTTAQETGMDTETAPSTVSDASPTPETIQEVASNSQESETSHSGERGRRRGNHKEESPTTDAAVSTEADNVDSSSGEITAAPEVETPTQQSSPSSCTVRCNKGCAYPGQCRKYIDANNNGLCDLGECL